MSCPLVLPAGPGGPCPHLSETWFFILSSNCQLLHSLPVDPLLKWAGVALFPAVKSVNGVRAGILSLSLEQEAS